MGPVAEYQKADAMDFGRAMGNLINATRGDGVGVARFTELIGLVTSAGNAMNEMKAVPEAAAEHIIGTMCETLGDEALAKALEAEKADEADGA